MSIAVGEAGERNGRESIRIRAADWEETTTENVVERFVASPPRKSAAPWVIDEGTTRN
jgi:hypothetical protein